LNVKNAQRVPKTAQSRMEEELRTATRAILTSSAIGAQGIDGMVELVRVTSLLPLSNMARWEFVIRSEFYLAEYELANTKKAKWRSLFPSALVKNVERARLESWIDLSIADGYARERALRRLDEPAPNGFFFALVIRRLNDWVAQVRDAARVAVPILASATDSKHVVDALCAMLPEWASWGRMEESERQTIINLVAITGVAQELMDRVISSPTGPMPQVLSQILRTSVLDKHLMEIAIRAVQPAVRA
jgi:hypothetical protein